MLRKILVPIDNSEMTLQVFNEALMLAQSTGASLRLLHVIDRTDMEEDELPLHLGHLELYSSDPDEHFICYIGHFEPFDSSLFADCVSAVTAAGVSVDCIHCYGEIEETICDVAGFWGADLIVMGRRGRSGLAEMILGSVSNHVVHHAPCSVYIVHRSNPPEAESACPIPVGLTVD